MIMKLRAVVSALSLNDRKRAYSERAEFYRARAVIESLQKAALSRTGDGETLITVAAPNALSLVDSSPKAKFARNRDGICFAVIKGDRFIPVDIARPNELLELSRRYERLSKSFWLRLLAEPNELVFGELKDGLERLLCYYKDSGFRLEIMKLRLARIQDEHNAIQREFDARCSGLADRSRDRVDYLRQLA